MRFYKAARYVKERLKSGKGAWCEAEVYCFGIVEVDEGIIAKAPTDFMYVGAHEAAADMLKGREGAVLCKHEKETLIGTEAPIPFREMVVGRLTAFDPYSAAGTLALLWDQEEAIGGLLDGGTRMTMIIKGMPAHRSRFSAISIDSRGPRGHTCIDRLLGSGLQFTVREEVASLMFDSSTILSPDEMDQTFLQWMEEERSKDPAVRIAMSAFKKMVA